MCRSSFSFRSYFAASRGTRNRRLFFPPSMHFRTRREHRHIVGLSSKGRLSPGINIDDVTYSRLKVAVCKRYRRHFMARPFLLRTNPQQCGVLRAFCGIVCRSSVGPLSAILGPVCSSLSSFFSSLVAINVNMFSLCYGLRNPQSAQEQTLFVHPLLFFFASRLLRCVGARACHRRCIIRECRRVFRLTRTVVCRRMA